MNKENLKLRVWWVSQLGTDAMYIPVNSVKEGQKIMDLLSCYDCFQYNHNIRPDYSNTGGLEMYDEEADEWVGWCYETEEEYCEDIDEYCEDYLSEEDKNELKEYEDILYSQVKFD